MSETLDPYISIMIASSEDKITKIKKILATDNYITLIFEDNFGVMVENSKDITNSAETKEITKENSNQIGKVNLLISFVQSEGPRSIVLNGSQIKTFNYDKVKDKLNSLHLLTIETSTYLEFYIV